MPSRRVIRLDYGKRAPFYAALRTGIALSTLLFLLWAAACSQQSGANTRSSTPSTRTDAFDGPSPTPGTSSSALGSDLGATVQAAIDSTYGTPPFNDQESKMIAFLTDLGSTEFLPNVSVPTDTELGKLVGAFPDGLDEDRSQFLEALYGLDTGRPFLPQHRRTDLLMSAFPHCVPSDALRVLSSLSRPVTDFYDHCAAAEGIVISSSQNVSSSALAKAQDIIGDVMTCMTDELRREVRESGVRVVIAGAEERLETLPEFSIYADFYGPLPKEQFRGKSTNWIAGMGEEFVLTPEFFYPLGYNAFAHEFGHLVFLVMSRSRNFEPTLDEMDAVYADAIASGRWSNTYAIVNELEFFPELLIIYLGLHTEEVSEGLSNGINGAEELATYDPAAYAILSELIDCPAS